MTRSPPWSPAENKAVIALYFAMLDKATAGEAYTKAAMIRHAQLSEGEELGNRSKQSIEFKLMNCSAAHLDIDANATTMHGFGYREMSNYQAALKEAMAAHMLGIADGHQQVKEQQA